MPTNVTVKSNVKAFLSSLDKVKKDAHLAIMNSMAMSLDEVRSLAALKYIHKNSWKGRRDRTSLINRTGLLRSALLSSGTWKIPRTGGSASLKAGRNIIMWIKPQRHMSSMSYLSRASFVEGGSNDIKYRQRNERGGYFNRTQRGRSIQQYIPPRPFIGRGLNDVTFKAEADMAKNLFPQVNVKL